MKHTEMLKLAKQAGFMMWSNEAWKPKGATIDWACNYDKELKKFIKLIENRCNKRGKDT